MGAVRVITATIAGYSTLHLAAVTLDTVFELGWCSPAFPYPFDEWQGVILFSFVGMQIAAMQMDADFNALGGQRSPEPVGIVSR